VSKLIPFLTANELEKLNADDLKVLNASVLHELQSNAEINQALRARVEAVLTKLGHKPEPWP